MEMTGERRIPAPRQQVWEALNDPEALRAAIPGCESVERVAEDHPGPGRGEAGSDGGEIRRQGEA
ncbi:SRPBCC domain-containing protein [Siccirubricoccus deserti]